MGIDCVVTSRKLEELKEASKKNADGLSNFKLIENKDGEEHFIFRVVCERVRLMKEVRK